MEEKTITLENLKKLCSELLVSDYDVVSAGKNGYKKLTAENDLSLISESKPSKVSFKEFVFPKAEPILYYKKSQNDVELIDIKVEPKPTVILGAKPCDIRSINILRKIFNWDYKDEFFNKRADNIILVGMMCNYSDQFCFCTSVNLSPVSTDGSDIFLVPLGENIFSLKIITSKGESFIKKFEKYLSAGAPDKAKAVEEKVNIPDKVFDAEKVREWIKNNFENKYWEDIGKMCLGCAQCAFVCPVCHCFDIVDEDYNYSEGRRMKNWDGCQFSVFTEHASGHNPRDNQSKRYRQRISHKFKYYPDKFNDILCTGCGRCSRGCPVTIDIKEIVTEINNFN